MFLIDWMPCLLCIVFRLSIFDITAGWKVLSPQKFVLWCKIFVGLLSTSPWCVFWVWQALCVLSPILAVSLNICVNILSLHRTSLLSTMKTNRLVISSLIEHTFPLLFIRQHICLPCLQMHSLCPSKNWHPLTWAPVICYPDKYNKWVFALLFRKGIQEGFCSISDFGFVFLSTLNPWEYTEFGFGDSSFFLAENLRGSHRSRYVTCFMCFNVFWLSALGFVFSNWQRNGMGSSVLTCTAEWSALDIAQVRCQLEHNSE